MTWSLVHTTVTSVSGTSPVGNQSLTIPATGTGNLVIGMVNSDGIFTDPTGLGYTTIEEILFSNQFWWGAKYGTGETSFAVTLSDQTDDVLCAVLEFSGNNPEFQVDDRQHALGTSSPQLKTDQSPALAALSILGDLIVGVAPLQNLAGGVPSAPGWDNGVGSVGTNPTLTNIVDVQTTSLKGPDHDVALYVGWAAPIFAPNTYRAYWTDGTGTANTHQLFVASFFAPEPPHNPNERFGAIPIS